MWTKIKILRERYPVKTIIVSFAYACFFSWLFWDRLCSFFTSKEIALNQVGDFVAGMFAPLAVLWLVTAVMTQKQELEETKKQFFESVEENRKQFKDSLDETREQFTAGQEVTKKQLELVHQANTNQHNQAVRDYKLSLFHDRMDIYNRLMVISEKCRNADLFRPFADELAVTTHQCRFLFGSDIADYTRDLSVQFGLSAQTEYELRSESTKNGGVPDTSRLFDDRRRQIDNIDARLNQDYLFHMFAKYLTVTDVALEAKANIHLGDDMVTKHSHAQIRSEGD